MTKISIYLSGCIDETSYRKFVNDKYKDNYILYDPIKINGVLNTNKNITKKQIFEIVKTDKEYIRKSDILIAFINKITFGTSMEIHYAYNQNIPVYIINPNLTFENDIWLSYHSTKIFDTIFKCFNYIDNQI